MSSAPLAWTPTSMLAKAVDLAGFYYDPGQDIIYSKMYPLQRNFGYAYGYDAAALLMSAVIDCEKTLLHSEPVRQYLVRFRRQAACGWSARPRGCGSTTACSSVMRRSRVLASPLCRQPWPNKAAC